MPQISYEDIYNCAREAVTIYEAFQRSLAQFRSIADTPALSDELRSAILAAMATLQTAPIPTISLRQKAYYEKNAQRINANRERVARSRNRMKRTVVQTIAHEPIIDPELLEEVVDLLNDRSKHVPSRAALPEGVQIEPDERALQPEDLTNGLGLK